MAVRRLLPLWSRVPHQSLGRNFVRSSNGIGSRMFSTGEEEDAFANINMPPIVPPGEPEPIDEEVKDIVHRIAELNLIQVSELTQALKLVLNYAEPEFVAGGAVAEDAAEPEEEKTEFDVKLVSFDAASKIKLIKEVRALTGLGLQESKKAVDGAPTVLKNAVAKAEAEEIVEKLKAVGGTVELE